MLIKLSEALQVSPSYFLDNDTVIENESKRISAFRINEAMNDIGMSQQELADLTKLGKASISHYVNGHHQPGNKAVLALANILGVNPAWLMGYDVPMARDTMQGPVSYYMDEETAALAQEMFEDPDMRSLFHMKRNMDPERFKTHMDFIKTLYKQEHPDDDDTGC